MNSRQPNRWAEASARNPAEFLVLGVLALGSSHGYDVYRHLNENIGTIWRLGRSQVYALLSKLEGEGLVHHQRVEQENFPAKKIYTLTSGGAELFHGWIASPVPSVRDMRLELLAKLHFARLICPGLETRLLHAQLDRCRARARELRRQFNDAETNLERDSMSFRIHMVEASIQWLQGMGGCLNDRMGERTDSC